jgi:predicted XRE-type DNA-binding protein
MLAQSSNVTFLQSLNVTFCDTEAGNFSTKGTEQVEPLLRMSQRELTRLEVIQRVERKTLKQRQAAELLGLSVRQVKRLCKSISARGNCGADF